MKIKLSSKTIKYNLNVSLKGLESQKITKEIKWESGKPTEEKKKNKRQKAQG